MTRTLMCAALFAALLGFADTADAAFTYHGSLQDAGAPAEGAYDIELTLYSAPSGGRVLAGPLVVYAVKAHEGAFVADVDFGSSFDSTGAAYVGVKLRKAGAADFTALDQRSVLAPDTNGGCPGAWSLDGNAGNAAGSYLGTADAKDVVIKAGGSVRMTLLAAKSAVGMSSAAIDATSGSASTAVSFAYAAKGNNSFAGGYSAGTNFDGSFVWGDHPASSMQVSDTGANQFIVQSGGGAAINGAPISASTPLSVYPSKINGTANAGIYIAGASASQGTLLSSTGGTGNNDVNFNVSNFNGSTQKLLAAFNRDGIGIGGATDPGTGLTIHPTTATNQSILELMNDGISTWTLDNATDGGFVMLSDTTAHGPVIALEMDILGNLAIAGNASKPGGGTWLASSDRRIKQDIAPIEDAVDTLLRLNPVSFHYTPEYRAAQGHLDDKTFLGFIAQEYAEVFPADVTRSAQRVPGAKDDEPRVLQLDSTPALITTVAAVRELATQLRERDAEVATLRDQLDKLGKRLDAIEAAKGN